MFRWIFCLFVLVFRFAGASYKFRLYVVYANGEHLRSARTERIQMPAAVVTDPPSNVAPDMAPQLILAKQTDYGIITLRWLYNGNYAERFIVQVYSSTDLIETA